MKGIEVKRAEELFNDFLNPIKLIYENLLSRSMITQGMVGEVETCMLRSFARTSGKVAPLAGRQKNFLSSANYKEDFIREFSSAMKERYPLLVKEIEKGGYRDPERLATSVHRLVESKLRAEISSRLLGDKGLDQNGFQKIVRDVKNEMRNVFYENYFSQ